MKNCVFLISECRPTWGVDKQKARYYLTAMFVKPLVKYNKTTKQHYNIFQLCESFRLDGRVRHRVIIGLGKLEESPDEEQKKHLPFSFSSHGVD